MFIVSFIDFPSDYDLSIDPKQYYRVKFVYYFSYEFTPVE